MKTVATGRIITGIALLVSAGVAAMFGLQMARSDAREAIYRDRLRSVVADYERLRDRYNDAVRQAAVTELVVADGALTVRVRSVDGAIAEVATDVDPSREVYVDYAVLGGRVWIRRVFDGSTAPDRGTLIDPELASIDWDADGAAMGKAVYRSLGTGRWVVSVTGNGALGLVRAPDDEPVELGPAPTVADYAEIERSLEDDLERIGFSELWARVIGG